jgi:DNA-binding Lrp family transcriptional regulator
MKKGASTDTTATTVRALIEVSITPQKDVGFDRIAERIYNFPEVKSCYLVSGGYDLLVVVEGASILTVADFVAAKLSSMENVRQTATHFLLRKYKEEGQILKQPKSEKRQNISY